MELFDWRSETNKNWPCPGGTSVETHSLAETLQMGSVPSVIDQPYLHATFQIVPAIIGENRTEVTMQMKELLQEEMEAFWHVRP